jgi:hypothetical protein
VSLQQLADLCFERAALFVDRGQGAGQRRHDRVRSGGAGHDDGLFVVRVEDVVDQAFGHARGFGAYEVDQLTASGLV